MDPLEKAEALVEMISDPSHLLPDENPATSDLATARRCLENYERLIVYKHDLLARSHQFIENSNTVVARAIRESDMILLEVQLSRFEQKRDYWKLRVIELAGRRGNAA